MEELNRSLHESVEQLRQRREQESQPKPAQPPPPATGEGVL